MKRSKRNFVKVGTIKIPWYRTNDGRTGVDLRSLGLKIRTFSDHASAIAEAERIARERHNGGAESVAFNANDRGVYAQLCEAAHLFGIEPPDAISEWRDARRQISGGAHSLAALVAAGVAALTKPVHRTIDIVFELLAAKEPHDLNKRYRRGLTTDLQAFAARFPNDISKVETKEIESFLSSFAYGTARRNAARDCVCHLFAFAKQRNYLPADKTSAAHQVTRIAGARAPIQFFAVWEMELFLAHVREPFVPWLACNSFSGARHEEILRGRDAARKKDPIRWEDFDWEDRAIAIREESAKQTTKKGGRARRVPILDNLFELLRPWRDRKATGPICTVYPGDYEMRRMVSHANKELAARKDIRRVAWRKNALRHSYGSYRMAIIQNEHQLAYEMGNSIEMIREHYHNPRPKSEAAAWFKLQRETPGNIIQIEMFGAA